MDIFVRLFFFKEHVLHSSLVPCRGTLSKALKNHNRKIRPLTEILHSTKMHHLLGTDNKINTLDNIISYLQNGIFHLFSMLSFVVIYD